MPKALKTKIDVEIAGSLQVSIGLLARRLRQLKPEGGPTPPEMSALARLNAGGPTTPGELAKIEEITPQSIGSTLAALESRGLVQRTGDPNDGRRAVVSITSAGSEMLRSRRDARTVRMAAILAGEYTSEELLVLKRAAPLIERLAQSI